MDQLIEDLKTFIVQNILSEEVVLDADTSLKSIGVDSFSIVEIVLFIERKFGKLIPDRLLVPETFESLNNIATVVKSLD